MATFHARLMSPALPKLPADIIQMLKEERSPNAILEHFDLHCEKSRHLPSKADVFGGLVTEALKYHPSLIDFIVRNDTPAARCSQDTNVMILCDAIINDNSDTVGILLGRGVDITGEALMCWSKDSSAPYRINPVECTVMHDNVDLLRALLRSRTSKGWFGRNQNTPLHFAACYKSPKCFQFLISLPNTDINARNSSRHTPLLMAAERQPDLIPILLDHGADVNCTIRDPAISALNLISTWTGQHHTPCECVWDYVSLAGLLVQAGIQKPQGLLWDLISQVRRHIRNIIENLDQYLTTDESIEIQIRRSDIRDCVRYIGSLVFDDELERGVLCAIQHIYDVFNFGRFQRTTPAQFSAYTRSAVLVLRYIYDILDIILTRTKHKPRSDFSEHISPVEQLLASLQMAQLENQILSDSENCLGEVARIFELLSGVPRYRTMQPARFLELMRSANLDVYMPLVDVYLAELDVTTRNSLIAECLKQVEGKSSAKDEAVALCLFSRMRTVWPLMQLAQRAIVRCFDPKTLDETTVSQLPIPRALMRYILDSKGF